MYRAVELETATATTMMTFLPFLPTANCPVTELPLCFAQGPLIYLHSFTNLIDSDAATNIKLLFMKLAAL